MALFRLDQLAGKRGWWTFRVGGVRRPDTLLHSSDGRMFECCCADGKVWWKAAIGAGNWHNARGDNPTWMFEPCRAPTGAQLRDRRGLLL